MTRKLKVVNARPASGEERRFRDLQSKLVEDQLYEVRDVAQNWRNGVGLGTFASIFASLTTTPELLRESEPQPLANSAWLIGAGTMLLLVALFLSLRASYGWPKFQTILSENDLRNWKETEANTTVLFLKLSVGFAVLGSSLLIAGYGVLLFQFPFPVSFPEWDK